MPFGLRKPVANSDALPLARSSCQMAARPCSCSMPFSPTLLFEPTVTYSVLPSALAIRFLVQWWFSGPPGKSMTFTPRAVIDVWPGWYGNFSTASVLATYKSLPASATPNGECKPCRNTVRVFATPFASISRNKVMRLAESVTAPAFFICDLTIMPLRPPLSSGRGGALVSTTSTSPLGST